MRISKYAFSSSSSVSENDLTLESLSFPHLWLWLTYILVCFAIIWSISEEKYRPHKPAASKGLIFAGILTQLTFEGIWIGSNRSPVTVIGRRLGRSVPRSVESGTTSQEGIIQNNRGLCWHCFYLQKITFLTQPYHIWLGLTLKIIRILTAARGEQKKPDSQIFNHQIYYSFSREPWNQRIITTIMTLLLRLKFRGPLNSASEWTYRTSMGWSHYEGADLRRMVPCLTGVHKWDGFYYARAIKSSYRRRG